MRFILFSIALIFLPTGMLLGQSEQQPSPNAASGAPHTVELEVPAGTPLPVVLADEVRIRKPGQVIHGKIAEPVYAFDQLVVPAGSEVSGSVTRIAGISAWQRTLAALDANFSRPAMWKLLSIN